MEALNDNLIFIQLDEEQPLSLSAIIKENTETDVCQIDEKELANIRSLKIGEFTALGMYRATRVK